MLGKERLKQWAEHVQPAGGLSPANQQRQKAFAFCEGGLSPIARAGLHSAVEMGRLDVYLLCYEIPKALPRGVYAVECQSLLARGTFDNAIQAGISSSFVGDLICARAVSKDSGWIISPSAIWLRPAPCPTTETFMHGHMFGSMAACPHVDVCPFKKSTSEDGEESAIKWWLLNYLAKPGEERLLAKPWRLPRSSPVLADFILEAEQRIFRKGRQDAEVLEVLVMTKLIRKWGLGDACLMPHICHALAACPQVRLFQAASNDVDLEDTQPTPLHYTTPAHSPPLFHCTTPPHPPHPPHPPPTPPRRPT